jgi:uncharacterized protein (TIGR03437 family)
VVSLALLNLTYAQQGEKEDVDDPRGRSDWFYGPRVDATGHIPLGARQKALAIVEKNDRAARLRPRAVPFADSATWTFLGPKPVDPGSSRVVSGRVTSIVVDPRNNNNVYVGSSAGGVWKSTDGGAHWNPIGDDQPSLAIGALALDPNDSNIIYAATGEEHGGYDNYYGVGVLKSTNGGASWTNLPGPFLHNYMSAIAVSPSNSQVLLSSAGNYYSPSSSGDGVWRSTDGAATWTRVLSGFGTSVAFDPTNGNIAYAALGDLRGSSANTLYRSTDGGQTWRSIRGSGANSLPTSDVGRIVIAIAPSTPSTIYAAIDHATLGNLMDVYKSTDSGATWNATNAPDVCALQPSRNGQCDHDMAIAIHPKNANLVYLIGELAMARTIDGGATWTKTTAVNNFFTGPNGVGLHCDLNVATFTADGNKLFVGSDGGAYSTTDVTASQFSQINWTELNDTLAIAAFYPGVATHPSDVNRALAGSQDNFTELFAGTLGWQAVACGDGGYNAFDLAFPSVALLACASANLPIVHRSTDGGATWLDSAYGIDVRERSVFIPPLVLDPSNGQNVYFGTYRIWQSRDSGGKFAAISPDLTAGGADAITAIAVAPSDGKTVYAAGSRTVPYGLYSAAASTKIHVTNNVLDASPGWNDRSNGLPPRVATSIAIDPIDAATAYVSFSGFSGGSDTQGHVFKTSNGGVNWTDISGNLPNIPVNDLVVDPDIANTVYAGTDVGVVMSSDLGATWTSVGKGLPKVVVHSLTLHRPTRTLRAGTNGRGLWDILVPAGTASRQPTISAVSPSTVNAGGNGFSLQVSGTNLVAGTVLRWNGSTRPTVIVDNNHLNATISAADIARVGRIAIDVFNPTRNAGVSNAVSLAVGPAPATTSAAIVNAAYPTGGDVVAPYSIASVYGTNLAGAIVVADQLPPLPLTLGGASLEISPVTLPLFFVSPGQINFQVGVYPTLTAQSSSTLVLTQGSLSSTVRINVRPFSPGLFTTNAQGTGQASALIAGTASIVAPTGTYPGSRPARKGEYVSLYCTGLGHVANAPALGDPAPSGPFATTLTSPTVSLGTANAPVSFSGMAPGYVGLYQVNILIPDNAPSGSAVPVVLTIGGVASNTATIAIQ